MNHIYMSGRKITQKLLRTYRSHIPNSFYIEPVDWASWAIRWRFSSEVDTVQIRAGISPSFACRFVVRIRATCRSYTSRTGTESTMTAFGGSTTTQKRLHTSRLMWVKPPFSSLFSALQEPGWELCALELKTSDVLIESCL